MNDSFKTFPKLVADPTTNEQNIIAWKKRIEKELRERLEADIQQLKEIPTSTRTKFAIDFIKEILGDE